METLARRACAVLGVLCCLGLLAAIRAADLLRSLR